MKQQKLVSVIVPCYNAEKYIEALVANVFSQTYQAFEILLINDGSQDRTSNICHNLAISDNRIRVFDKMNGGAASARNMGIEKANGEYLYFADADDYFEADLLEQLVKAAEESNADMVICGYFMEILRETQQPIVCIPYHSDNQVLLGQESIRASITKLADRSMLYNTWNKLYRKNVLEVNNLRFRNVTYVEDCVFNMEYLPQCSIISVVQSCLYHYIRERTGAVTRVYQPQIFHIRQTENEYMMRCFETIAAKSAEDTEYLARHFAERILNCIENEASRESRKTLLERIRAVKLIITDADVQNAFRMMRPTSIKIALIALPVRWRMPMTCLMIGYFISFVHTQMPAVYLRQKAKR